MHKSVTSSVLGILLLIMHNFVSVRLDYKGPITYLMVTSSSPLITRWLLLSVSIDELPPYLPAMMYITQHCRD